MFLEEPAKKGQSLIDCKIIFRRPGSGIRPDQFEDFKKGFLSKDLEAGHMLSFNDIKFK